MKEKPPVGGNNLQQERGEPTKDSGVPERVLNDLLKGLSQVQVLPRSQELGSKSYEGIRKVEGNDGRDVMGGVT